MKKVLSLMVAIITLTFVGCEVSGKTSNSPLESSTDSPVMSTEQPTTTNEQSEISGAEEKINPYAQEWELSRCSDDCWICKKAIELAKFNIHGGYEDALNELGYQVKSIEELIQIAQNCGRVNEVSVFNNSSDFKKNIQTFEGDLQIGMCVKISYDEETLMEYVITPSLKDD